MGPKKKEKPLADPTPVIEPEPQPVPEPMPEPEVEIKKTSNILQLPFVCLTNFMFAHFTLY